MAPVKIVKLLLKHGANPLLNRAFGYHLGRNTVEYTLAIALGYASGGEYGNGMILNKDSQYLRYR